MIQKIFVKAKPNASKEKFCKIDEQHFEVHVKESPVDGKANRAIEALIARQFKVPKTFVKVIRGVAGKNKVVEIGAK